MSNLVPDPFEYDGEEFSARYEQVPTVGGTATNYHESVDDLRRDLMKGVAFWEKVTDEYKDPADKVQARLLSAALMAGGYGYTLAAVLGYARKYGEHVAHDLASEADEILTNGDFEDMNADVKPGDAFGDHAEITVKKDGIQIEFYDHP